MEKRVCKLNFYHPVIEKIESCFEKAYLVGGFVRDKLLGISKDTVDIDIVTVDELLKVKECISKVLKASSFTFEKEKTVITFLSDKFRLDISNLHGKTLEEDLLKRDFTINAIAVDLKKLFSSSNDYIFLIDPFGGFEDLKKRLIRPINEKSLRDDPVRIIRGVRFKILLQFDYHPSFLNYSKKILEKLKESPTERIKEELIKILRIDKTSEALKDFNYIGIFPLVFPELVSLESVYPSGVHEYNLKEHTLKTVEFFEKFCLKEKDKILLEFSEKVGQNELLPTLLDSHFLKLVALYHDVGKPSTVNKRNGRLTFYNHDKVGAKITKDAFLRLGFGKKAASLGFKVIKNHLRPFFLYELFKKEKLSDKAIYNFFKNAEPYSFHTLLHSVADWMATSKKMECEVSNFIKFIHFLLRFYRERLENLKPLLSGKEIMEIKGFDKPNKYVGKIKEKLLELQAIGKVKTVKDAVNFVKGYTCENSIKS
ncbi:polynucleotide adenylyltransferase/metal dependent phosphohydrolase [Desulfurobacterium thermolithotrophum DSM 11699]|uniref:Polynucleotide adenylyltransferase/metal dependent phosphohydrolase n=1 Tax=Desulfurobacterium thermolithotrophum (strain DSM 11699 / BSA) TaxID=868864 RepID=F0S123_DESTD|nr:HD domain-containing protein [Desulfurobacterium thermolithotrophum]ADY73901.1 polynucleotide adenylyltransferase/metal dependent phosphohydrolase [Desulfurobacterium thermolithotrophum DSM 11699]